MSVLAKPFAAPPSPVGEQAASTASITTASALHATTQSFNFLLRFNYLYSISVLQKEKSMLH
jgi:hypothetical protein